MALAIGAGRSAMPAANALPLACQLVARSPLQTVANSSSDRRPSGSRILDHAVCANGAD